MYHLPGDDRDISTAVRDLLSECSALLHGPVVLDRDPLAPKPWYVWAVAGDEPEIVGAGESPDEAAAEALAQARRWAEAPAL